MTQLTQEEREAVEAIGWTEEEVTGFARALDGFRDGLPPRQRETFTAILRAAGATAAADDVRGHVLSVQHTGRVSAPGRVAFADDDGPLSGGALAVLLLAVGGAVAGVLY